MTIVELEQHLAAARAAEPAEDPRLTRYSLEARHTAYRNAATERAECDLKWNDDTRWHAFLVSARKTIGDELLATYGPRDPRVMGLKLSLMQIDRGLDFWGECMPARMRLDDLMAEAGYQPDGRTLAQSCGACWKGSLHETERRLRDLDARRAAAQAQMDRALRDEAPDERTEPQSARG